VTKRTEKHRDWCRSLFASLADDGVWAIPRSGLLFTKRDGKLLLIAKMPHDPEMPISAEELNAAQEADYEYTKQHFGEAGITVDKSDTMKED
jgi:hypothetical protein